MNQLQLPFPMDWREEKTRCELVHLAPFQLLIVSFRDSIGCFCFYRIAVYDLGGGTFDISILEIQKGVFEVWFCSLYTK